MNKLALAFAVLAVLYFWHQHKGDATRASAYLAAAKQPDPCEGKKFCATIYVAPWCPACKSELPRFRGYLDKARTNKQKDYGLKIVVGNGQKQEDNEAMAKQLGAGAVLDTNGQVFAQLKVTKFPSFYVLDGEKSVILSDREAFQWIHEKF